MAGMPTKLKALFALWLALGVLNAAAANPVGLVVALWLLVGLWRGGDATQWLMAEEAVPMMAVGVLTLTTASTGAQVLGWHPLYVWAPLVGGTVFLSIVGMLTIATGGYTFWALQAGDVQEALGQQYIRHLEAKIEDPAV